MTHTQRREYHYTAYGPAPWGNSVDILPIEGQRSFRSNARSHHLRSQWDHSH